LNLPQYVERVIEEAWGPGEPATQLGSKDVLVWHDPATRWRATLANGMGFTRDARHFYWTCSTTRRIFRFDYERETGALSNRVLFHRATDPNDTPDGLTLDAEDRVYSARWGGSCVLRLDANGGVAERLPLPVERVSSVAFGGPAFDTLYVTTAAGAPGGTGDDGTLYRIRTDARGRAEHRSRVLI